MAGTLIRELFVKIGIISGDSDEELKQIDAGINAVVNTLELFDRAAQMALGAFNTFVTSGVQHATEVASLAALLGTSTGAIQELSYAAAKTGVNVRDLAELGSELAENIGEAAGGSGEAFDAFKSLGISVKDSNGKLKEVPPMLEEIADKMATMANGQAKTAALMGLFGEQGIQLLPMLNGGSKAMRAMAKEAQELGIVVDEKLIKANVELGKSWSVIEILMQSFTSTLSGELAPTFQEILKDFREWWVVNREGVKNKIWLFFRVVASAARGFWVVVKILNAATTFLYNRLLELSVVMGAVLLRAIVAQARWLAWLAAQYFALGTAAIWAGLKAAASWFLALAPFIAIAALIAALILLFDDFIVWLKGGDSMIGRLWNKYKGFLKDWLEPSADDGWIMKSLKETLSYLFKLIEIIDSGALVNPFTLAFQEISNFFYDIAEKLRYLIEAMAYVGNQGAQMWLDKLDQRQVDHILKLQNNALQQGKQPVGEKIMGSTTNKTQKTVIQNNKIEINGADLKDARQFGKELNKSLGGFGDDALRILTGIGA